MTTLLVGDINALPLKGYITDVYLLTINKCKDDVSDKKLLNYKFSYFKKKEDVVSGYNDPSPQEIIIQNWSKYSEVLYEFPALNPEENYKYYIRGYCRDEFNVSNSETTVIEVHDIPRADSPKQNITLKESFASIDLDDELTSDSILKRAKTFASSTTNFEREEEELNRTSVTTFNKKGILQENLILNDPIGKNRDIYCNFNGDSYVVHYYLVCDCDGKDGNNCKIDHESYDYMIQKYHQLFNRVKSLQTGKYNKDLIQSLHYIMKSAAEFMNIENMDFMLESIEFINLYRNKFKDEMLEGNNYEMYFDIYNSLIEYGLSIVNRLKFLNFIKKNSKNVENCYNEDLLREATLEKGQTEIIQDYFNKVKVSLQNLLEFYALNKKEIRFINKNVNVYVSLIDNNFDVNSYFVNEKKLYEPYFNFKHCLEKTMIQSQGSPSYRAYLSSIVWKVSPYMSNEELYWNNSSPTVSFKFLDYDTGEKIYLSDCGQAENQIELYFPVSNYDMVKKINEKRMLLSPEKQYNINDGIFCDPVYINKSGAVSDLSLEERRQTFFLGFNFSCKYYKVQSEDQNNIKLSNETLDYNKYLKENYIKCLSNKLMQESYSEFVVDYYKIPAEFHLNSRFFYLRHYKILSWKANYKNNHAFYYFVMLSAVYVGLSLIYIYFEKYHYVNMQRLGELRKEITKLNLPYRDEYIFNNDLQVGEDIKGKMNNKRKPNMEEMNLDTNNLNVGIMADEISKFNKGFKSKENVFGFTPQYFGIKEAKNLNMNSKFFPDEIDIRKYSTNENEVTPEKLEKMKNFYQVGFKGLDSKENTGKEMQLSKDKKRIIIRKKENLSRIMETEEFEDINFETNDFFNKEENKETDQRSHTRNKSNRIKEDKLSEYKDFISSENLNSQSQMKSSKRETATKKFFNQNPNPPKKEKNVAINPYVFSLKDQQKIGKEDAKFFAKDDSEITNKNKKKPKNLFQKDYDNIYKPGFKGPKVITENLGFYNKETLDFEQGMDNDNKNPPYFGKRFRKILSKNEENKGKGENAGMRVGFYFKNRQIDLIDNEEEMPELSENLTFEKKMEEFHDYSISFKKFLIKNIISRHILLTTFDRMSIVYKRYMRAGNFAAQLAMFAFFLSIFFVNDGKQIALVTKDKTQITNLILYCLYSNILGCIAVHLPAYCFWVNDKKFRKLYHTIKEDGGINVLKQTDEIINQGRIFWNILGIVIQIIYIFIGFYFSFGFCATYSYQRSTFSFSLICTCIFDFLISEFLWEIIIGLLFYIRDIGRLIVFIGTILNTLRNIKHLVI